MITIDDRTTQGFLAGVIGSVAEMFFILTMFFGFHFNKLRYMDFAAVFAFNHRPVGLFQSIIAEMLVYIFYGLLGVIRVSDDGAGITQECCNTFSQRSSRPTRR